MFFLLVLIIMLLLLYVMRCGYGSQPELGFLEKERRESSANKSFFETALRLSARNSRVSW